MYRNYLFIHYFVENEQVNKEKLETSVIPCLNRFMNYLCCFHILCSLYMMPTFALTTQSINY